MSEKLTFTVTGGWQGWARRFFLHAFSGSGWTTDALCWGLLAALCYRLAELLVLVGKLVIAVLFVLWLGLEVRMGW